MRREAGKGEQIHQGMNVHKGTKFWLSGSILGNPTKSVYEVHLGKQPENSLLRFGVGTLFYKVQEAIKTPKPWENRGGEVVFQNRLL